MQLVYCIQMSGVYRLIVKQVLVCSPSHLAKFMASYSTVPTVCIVCYYPNPSKLRKDSHGAENPNYIHICNSAQRKEKADVKNNNTFIAVYSYICALCDHL